MDSLVIDESLAVIPARGGSQRIPGKNLVSFHGRPMLAWTVEAARHAGVFDRIVVSTDSEEIARVGESCGAEVPFLRRSAVDPVSPVSEATAVALEQAKEHYRCHFGTVTQLMPNCPLRGAAEILRARDEFRSDDRAFQISCVEFGWTNPWWANRIGEYGKAYPVFPEVKTRRSQDLPRLYAPTGAVWMAKAASLLRTRSFYGEGYRLVPVSRVAGVDIDDKEDLRMAAALFALKEG